MKKVEKIIVMVWICGILFLINTTISHAYVKTGLKFNNPSMIKYYIMTPVSQYSSTIIDSMNTWKTANSKFGFIRVYTSTSDANIVFNGFNNIDNGTYAVCTSNIGGNSQKHTITLYKAGYNAANLVRNEVFVHEVGHSLGLDHCQPFYDSSSVMRRTGFNYKAYPLTDDKNGIKAIYK